MISSKFANKEILFLKGYLKGRGFNSALKAINLAETAHMDVLRKSGEPFVSHPIRIANALVSLGVDDEKILIVAILHDILEDTNVTREELLDTFKEDIVDSVELLTTMYFFNEQKTRMYIEETEKYIIPLCSFVSNNYPELSNYAYYMKYHIESILETTKHFIDKKKNCY